jgi:beta-lactamase class A
VFSALSVSLRLNYPVRHIALLLSFFPALAAADVTDLLERNGETVFPQASSIKIPTLIQMFRCIRAGEFSLADKVTLTPEETVGGSGHLQKQLVEGPVTLTVRASTARSTKWAFSTPAFAAS